LYQNDIFPKGDLMAFIVYFGTVNWDNHDRYPTHKIIVFETAEAVETFYTNFKNQIRCDDGEIEFRVFKGDEMAIRPIEIVTKYKLGEV
jgi:hypothetical protein